MKKLYILISLLMLSVAAMAADNVVVRHLSSEQNIIELANPARYLILPVQGMPAPSIFSGFGNSNIFPVIFSQALNRMPEKQNEVSGLMIMGLFGGTVFPLAMGYASDGVGAQWGAVAVMTVGVLYLLFYTSKIKKA